MREKSGSISFGWYVISVLRWSVVHKDNADYNQCNNNLQVIKINLDLKSQCINKNQGR
jgi:hypothetical protein